jgi:hypothetical protein
VEGEKGALQATIEDMAAELAQFEVRPHPGRPYPRRPHPYGPHSWH